MCMALVLILIFTNENPVKRIDGSHHAAVGWALRQFIPIVYRSSQVSVPRGRNLYAALVLVVFEVVLPVPC